MKINKKIFISSIILFLFFIFLLIFITSIEVEDKIETEISLTFFINFIITIIAIIKDSKKYSLNKMFWYFNLFFLILAPFLQKLYNVTLWGYKLNNDDYIKTNIIVMCWSLLFFVCYNIKSKGSKKNNNIRIFKLKGIKDLLIILSILSLILMIAFVGPINLFKKGNSGIEIFDTTINTLITNMLRSIPIYSSFYYIYSYKEKKSLNTKIRLIISLIIMFVLNYPASITRYWIGAIYIGLFIVLIRNKIKNRTFDYIIMIVIGILFPIFQLFKWYTFGDILSGEVKLKNLLSGFTNVDFDAYSIIPRTIAYINTNGINIGKQFLAIIFFIVPRKIWNNKPYPSGQTIAEVQGQFFTNISCPLISEAIINFGYLGIPIFSFILASILRYLDDKYWKSNINDEHSTINYVYPLLFGLLIFILRGALQPAIVFTFSMYLFLLIFFLVSRKDKENVE